MLEAGRQDYEKGNRPPTESLPAMQTSSVGEHQPGAVRQIWSAGIRPKGRQPPLRQSWWAWVVLCSVLGLVSVRQLPLIFAFSCWQPLTPVTVGHVPPISVLGKYPSFRAFLEGSHRSINVSHRRIAPLLGVGWASFRRGRKL